MEMVKYLCEFFFGNFWHWAGGLFYLTIIFCLPLGWIYGRINNNDKDEQDKK